MHLSARPLGITLVAIACLGIVVGMYWRLQARPWPEAAQVFTSQLEAVRKTGATVAMDWSALIPGATWDRVAIIPPHASTFELTRLIGASAKRVPGQEASNGWMVVFLQGETAVGYFRSTDGLAMQAGIWPRREAQFEVIPASQQGRVEVVQSAALAALVTRPRLPPEPIVFLTAAREVNGFPYVEVAKGARASGPSAYHVAFLDGVCTALEAITQSCAGVQEVYLSREKTPKELVPVSPVATIRVVMQDAPESVGPEELKWPLLRAWLERDPAAFAERPFHLKRVGGKIVTLDEIYSPILK